MDLAEALEVVDVVAPAPERAHQALLTLRAELLAADRAQQRIDAAPLAIMDTRDALGICAPTEEAFPALYALQGKRVRLVVDESENAALMEREP